MSRIKCVPLMTVRPIQILILCILFVVVVDRAIKDFGIVSGLIYMK